MCCCLCSNSFHSKVLVIQVDNIEHGYWVDLTTQDVNLIIDMLKYIFKNSEPELLKKLNRIVDTGKNQWIRDRWEMLPAVPPATTWE